MINDSWIAGFFDAEGNINKIYPKGKLYFQIRIYQAGDIGLFILTKIQKFLGMGHIHCRKSRQLNHKDMYELNITKKQDCYLFAKRFYKLLYKKGNKLKEIIEIFEK